jgi:SHS2 domain-containing protein
MSEIIKQNVTGHPSDIAHATQVEIGSPDITTLLIDFLNEILTKDVIEKTVYFDVIQIELSDTELLASVRGIAANAFDEDIKAVTYHGADVRQNSDGNYQVEVVFDV